MGRRRGRFSADFATKDSLNQDTIGQHGSIAVVERFILSLKNECFRRFCLPLTLPGVEKELELYVAWYNEHRPHQGLCGATPSEIIELGGVACRWRERAPPRDERERPPLRLVVSHVEGRAHLPVIELKRAA